MSKDNLITCKTWIKTKKCRIDCPFRHSTYHEVKPRKDIMCYWEDKGGCTKYRCEYKHNDPQKDEWKEVRVKSLTEIIHNKSTIEKELNTESRPQISIDDVKKESEVDLSMAEVVDIDTSKATNIEVSGEIVKPSDTSAGTSVDATLESSKIKREITEKPTNDDVKRSKKEVVYEDIDEEIKDLDKELEELDDILNDE